MQFYEGALGRIAKAREMLFWAHGTAHNAETSPGEFLERAIQETQEALNMLRAAWSTLHGPGSDTKP